jgi:peptide deformylase
LKRICAIRIEYFKEDETLDYVTEFAFINPKIVAHAQRMSYLLAGEGCLSVDGEHQGYVPRYAFVTVRGYDAITRQYLEVKFRGYDAIVIQHEIDHLDGILFYDRINKQDPFKKIEGALEI